MSDYGGGEDDMGQEYGAGEQVTTFAHGNCKGLILTVRCVGTTWTT